ncbi:hypothetical protein VTN00DRAFT_5494 [Thermoascus crustaceus]|uniref:uncharacterized protein n=1 Tax=Thermoascus crustaceus TaxID=5088 RepID=UPI003743A276
MSTARHGTYVRYTVSNRFMLQQQQRRRRMLAIFFDSIQTGQVPNYATVRDRHQKSAASFLFISFCKERVYV